MGVFRYRKYKKVQDNTGPPLACLPRLGFLFQSKGKSDPWRGPARWLVQSASLRHGSGGIMGCSSLQAHRSLQSVCPLCLDFPLSRSLPVDNVLFYSLTSRRNIPIFLQKNCPRKNRERALVHGSRSCGKLGTFHLVEGRKRKKKASWWYPSIFIGPIGSPPETPMLVLRLTRA